MEPIAGCALTSVSGLAVLKTPPCPLLSGRPGVGNVLRLTKGQFKNWQVKPVRMWIDVLYASHHKIGSEQPAMQQKKPL